MQDTLLASSERGVSATAAKSLRPCRSSMVGQALKGWQRSSTQRSKQFMQSANVPAMEDASKIPTPPAPRIGWFVRRQAQRPSSAHESHRFDQPAAKFQRAAVSSAILRNSSANARKPDDVETRILRGGGGGDRFLGHRTKEKTAAIAARGLALHSASCSQSCRQPVTQARLP